MELRSSESSCGLLGGDRSNLYWTLTVKGTHKPRVTTETPKSTGITVLTHCHACVKDAKGEGSGGGRGFFIARWPTPGKMALGRTPSEQSPNLASDLAEAKAETDPQSYRT